MKKMEGSKGFANMPQEVKMKDWPKCAHYSGSEIDDTITGIDDVNSRSVGKAKKNISKQK